jgi:hypothetical protein
MHLELKQVKSVAELVAVWAAPRSSPGRTWTNLFPRPDLLTGWLEDGEIYGHGSPHASMILRQDRDFFHLYINYNSEESAEELLSQLDNAETFVIDVVGNENSHEETIGMLQRVGFNAYKTLYRIERTSTDDIKNTTSTEVRLASPSMAEPILEQLELHFDRFCEQLPTHREISLAIAEQKILVINQQHDEVAGFLFHDTKPSHSLLRYWFVDAASRDTGIGSQLMTYYLNRKCVGRISQLWVISDNFNAMKRYAHYGYTRGRLVDYVLVKEGRGI